MPELRVERLTKRFGEVVAVNDISFTVKDGEFLTLLGPSGCGKSTTLAAIAGLDMPDEGFIGVGDVVFFDGARRRFMLPEERNCGLVFQSYALWPHMTVRANLAFPLKLRKIPRREQQERIEEALRLVEMGKYLDRYPHELSGGQQQRVALARVLVYKPSLLLLDEPLSNLDAKLRDRARTWLKQLQSQVGITTLYVTHDQIEALALSDRIAVMRDGDIVQLDIPKVVYESPGDPFVADFIGTSNFIPVVVSGVGENGTAQVTLSGGMELTVTANRGLAAGAHATLALRPERVQILPAGATSGDGVNLLRGKTVTRSYLGSVYQYQLQVGDLLIRADSPVELSSSEVQVRIPPEACALFTREVGDERIAFA
jgi:iron(III) transport system ATP-binding protein